MHIFPCVVRGQDRCGLDRTEAGRRRRTFFPTVAEAAAEAERLRGKASELKQQGDVWLRLPASERSQVIEAYCAARANGLPADRLFAVIADQQAPCTKPPSASDDSNNSPPGQTADLLENGEGLMSMLNNNGEDVETMCDRRARKKRRLAID